MSYHDVTKPMTPEVKAFKANIKKYAKENNLNNVSLANLIGIDQGNLWRILYTNRSTTLETAVKICRAINVDLDSMLK